MKAKIRTKRKMKISRGNRRKRKSGTIRKRRRKFWHWAMTSAHPPSFHRSWMKLLDELLSSAVTLSLRGSMFLVSQLAAL